MAFNHNLTFRPLRGGIAILNPKVNKTGTLGLIATSDGQDRWVVSCYHVLGRIDFSVFSDNEPIFQSGDPLVDPVAFTSVQRSNSGLDCAAAKVGPGIGAVADILGLPAIAGVGQPVAGMRVIKSGSVTGLTEGTVRAVQNDQVIIELLPGFAPTYELSEEGDSGAIWVSRDSLEAVALHKAGTNSGIHEARATVLTSALAAMNLQLLV